MFKKILIANRGEIALRIIGTCNRMGIGTVAVFSEADSDALHVKEADESCIIGGATPEESYLRIDKMLDAAKEKVAKRFIRVMVSCQKMLNLHGNVYVQE